MVASTVAKSSELGDFGKRWPGLPSKLTVDAAGTAIPLRFSWSLTRKGLFTLGCRLE
jgi:hypothetical protein